MKKSLLFALCLGLATITAAAQRNYSQVDPIQPVPTAKEGTEKVPSWVMLV